MILPIIIGLLCNFENVLGKSLYVSRCRNKIFTSGIAIFSTIRLLEKSVVVDDVVTTLIRCQRNADAHFIHVDITPSVSLFLYFWNSFLIMKHCIVYNLNDTYLTLFSNLKISQIYKLQIRRLADIWVLTIIGRYLTLVLVALSISNTYSIDLLNTAENAV